ncbi:MAG: DUF4340 domain-containing protein [Methylococcales bacterium]|jgi:hypothetical protein|nr:DUF4340 domain-containing protein [Methylococcales bacterium]MBT7410915.1 DUF4340 domain-containing protein [Methylococcales bacterium]
MKKIISTLAILLLIQTVLTLILSSTGSDYTAFKTEEKLLELNIKALDKIVITDIKKASLILAKKDGQWRMPAHGDFPVSKVQFSQLTGKLENAKKSWPIATTQSAAKRFKVDEDYFEKKLEFYQNGKIKKIMYLGSSPKFRKVTTRIKGDNNIYSIDFNAFEASIKEEDWFDKGYLTLNKDDMQQININGIELVKKDKEFKLNPAQTAQLNQAEVKKLLSQITSITFQTLLDTSKKTTFKFDWVFALQMKSGKVDYKIAKLDKTEDFVLKLSSQPYYFKISKQTVENLKKFNKTTLIVQEVVKKTPIKSTVNGDATTAPLLPQQNLIELIKKNQP